ncbi:hypothetical protein KFE25_008393 [Diacronema lutheri]|uniref:CRAL-TRIO domain-containing protein n=1 Tax=Diacronema lutheri TaxID=2081491 RepID=A0A7R9UTI8_DIALT|nr:hypothetical protein KFE25_008393 [Diacronema lutheri]
MGLPAFGTPVAELRARCAPSLDALLARTEDARDPGEHDELWVLRFVLEHADVNVAEAALRATLAWQRGEGAPIVRAAKEALAAATAGGGWNNEPIVERAPHAALIRPFMGAAQVQTIPSKGGEYLIYTIRASAIDDKALMRSVSAEQLSDFFVFAKEVNARVALQRTAATGKLVGLVTANDLTGISLFGSSQFRSALSAASKRTAALYPALLGPTVLLNLPPLLGALVKLFTPLFPKAVLDKLRFESGPLKDVADLRVLLRSAGGPERDAFLADIDACVRRR